MKKVIFLIVAASAALRVYLYIADPTNSATAAAPACAQQSTTAVKFNPLRDAYYGDLHLHSSYSFDPEFPVSNTGRPAMYS
ncbi:MAG: hypothetical protein HY508_02260 [Acidobacteria bacterium]|nr:hypothetical protein [Acidobacteriota bacterium]